MKLLPIFAALLLPAALLAAEPIIDIYVSTGDNHYLGSSLPIDSPASVEATFDLFKSVNHARRVYWRGLEEACWLSSMQARAENPRYYSFWQWLEELYRTSNPDTLAVRAAHARGMEIWGMGSLWDWGAPADTPGFGDYPFTFESKLKLEHPEWAPADKQGVRRQGGPIELAYPAARKALIELIVKETLKAGYDGISFLTYVENYSLRFADEFGYSDPIVADFQRLYKLDLRTVPFQRGASREDWLRLRGSYVTAFLRELKAELAPHGIKLGMVVNSNDPRQPQSWNVPELTVMAGSQFMDVETWVREGLVDELLVYGNNSTQSQMKTQDDLRFLARGTATSVSLITSGPFRENWKPYQESGVATIVAVSDDTQHLECGFVPEQPAGAIKSGELNLRLRVLAQHIAGTVSLNEADLIKSAGAPNLLERRLALQALGKSKTADLRPLLDGLRDPENGVRCVAALVLGERKDPAACAALLQAAAAHGNHMLRECVVIALRRLVPAPLAEIGKAARHAADERTREVAMRALIVHANASLLPVFRAGLQDCARFVRFAAAESLGNFPHPEAIELLLGALQHEDVAVANRAAVSLGRQAVSKRAGAGEWRAKGLAALLAAFRRAPDDGWSFRPIGNAILDFGEEGAAALRAIRDGTDEARLREQAWRVVDLTQRMGTFSTVSVEQNEAAMQRRPGPPTPAKATSLRVDPSQGSDANDGRTAPVKTIARAIKLAQPGDTIHLAPGTYHESADFSNKHGLPDQPITLDGHGAVLDGSELIQPADWESLGADLYRKVKLLPRMDDAIRVRWFFLWNGRMNRMGLCSKGPSLPLKKPADLLPDEWTYVQAEDAFYVKLPAGQTLAEANLRYPARGSGVVMGTAGSWLTVRNLTGTHVYNDGYNIHGAQRHLVFENIAAVECGDDGFSAHEDAECRIEGFTSIGNATGLCDAVSSITHYRNVFIKDCQGYDIYFIGDSPHSMENVLVESSAARPLEIAQHTDRPQNGTSAVTLKNVLLRRAVGHPGDARVSRNGKLTLEHCTLEGVNFLVTPGGEVTLRHSVLRGDPKPGVLLFPNTIWQGEGNFYDLASFRMGSTSYTARLFADLQKATASEIGSRWEAAAAPAGLGADEPSLSKLRPAP